MPVEPLILLGRNIDQLRLLEELDLLSNGGIDELANNAPTPTGDVAAALAPNLAVEAECDDTSTEDVGKSKLITNDEAVTVQVLPSNRTASAILAKVSTDSWL